MKLTERQSDALSELINIAFARTGAALSELTGHRVILESTGGCGLSNGRVARSAGEICSRRCRFHSSGFCRTESPAMRCCY